MYDLVNAEAFKKDKIPHITLFSTFVTASKLISNIMNARVSE